MSDDSQGRNRVGAIHGRFQPFHNGHLRYLEMALQLSDLLYVGITNPHAPGHGKAESTDSHRHLAESNPFSFDERRQMVIRSVEHRQPGASERLIIVPFDINADPSIWRSIIPHSAVQYVVPHEPWDREKALRFERDGYSVVLLATQPGRVTATDVRRRIAENDPQWRALVPSGTASYLVEEELLIRLQEVTPSEPLKEGAANGV